MNPNSNGGANGLAHGLTTGHANTGMNGHTNGHLNGQGMAMTGMTPGMGVTQNVPVQGLPQMGGPNGMTAPNGIALPVGVAVAQQMPLRHLDEARKKDVELRREIHKALLEHLDLATIDAKKLDDPSMRPKVLNALRRIVAQMDAKIPRELDRDQLIGELSDEALGLGPLERFLSDPTVSEIMVVDPNTIYVEHLGKIRLSEARFTDDERVRAVIERIVTPLGRRIDESSPLRRRAPEGRLARERGHQADRAARLVHHDPQVREGARSRSRS